MSEIQGGKWRAANPIYNYCTEKMMTGGMIWNGDENATLEDIEELQSVYGPNVHIDVPTLFGGESFYYRVKDKPCYQAPPLKL